MKKKYLAHACVCVTRESLIFYSPELPELSSILVTDDIMKDLEVINQPSLERIIKNWLRQTQFVPKTLSVYFVNDMYFFEDVSKVPVSIEDPTVVSFIETVPFTDVVTKIFPTQNGARIVAINRDLLQPMISVLERSGFSVVVAAPSFAAGISSKTPFSKELAQSSLSDESLFITYNFIEEADIEGKLEAKKSFLSVKFDKKLILMSVFFLILIIVLIVLVISQN